TDVVSTPSTSRATPARSRTSGSTPTGWPRRVSVRPRGYGGPGFLLDRGPVETGSRIFGGGGDGVTESRHGGRAAAHGAGRHRPAERLPQPGRPGLGAAQGEPRGAPHGGEHR